MFARFDIDDSIIVSEVEHNYYLCVQNITFLPKGDTSFIYIITCENGIKYFLKLLAKDTVSGKARIEQLDCYLPVTWEMHQKGLCKNISYPIKSIDGCFQVDIGVGVIVIFNYIEGETLADAYPFSRLILENVAKAIGEVHKATYHFSSTNTRIENFEIPFESRLIMMLKELEGRSRFHDHDRQNLRDFIVSREKIILSFLGQLREYQKSVKRNPKEMFFTHGDMWGGNMILDLNSELNIVDWESLMIASPEADLHLYIGEDFDYFIGKYREKLGFSVNLVSDYFGYYAYKSQLSNLTNWMSRILYDNQSSEQKSNDFEGITIHCMARWDDVADKIRNLRRSLF